MYSLTFLLIHAVLFTAHYQSASSASGPTSDVNCTSDQDCDITHFCSFWSSDTQSDLFCLDCTEACHYRSDQHAEGGCRDRCGCYSHDDCDDTEYCRATNDATNMTDIGSCESKKKYLSM